LILNKIQSLSNALICIAFFLLNSSPIFSQKISLGIKANPTLCITQVSKGSTINYNYFKVLNYRIGYQLGLVGTLKLDPIIIDLQCFLSNKKTGLKFNGYQNDYEINQYGALSIVNKLFVGYKIKTNLDPYYEIYIGPNFGYEIFRNFFYSGGSNLNYYNEYQLKDTIIFNRTKFNGFTVGLAIKINTELKKLGRISYGISYDYLPSVYPEIDVNYKMNNIKSNNKLIPRVSALSFDFIYYFKKRRTK